MKKILILTVLAGALFLSCGKEGVNDDAVLNETDLKIEAGDLSGVPCVVLVYPITYIMPDRTTLTRGSAEEMTAALTRWYNAHPDVRKTHVLQFPVDILFRGKAVTLASQQQMQRVRTACAGDRDIDRVPCLELVYPITYILPDRTAITRNSEDEMNAALRRWYQAHPDAPKRHILQLPVDVKFKGKALTITTQQQLERVKNACK
jgi:hypothetical protein